MRARSAALWRLRSFFKEREFLEVQTPVLSRDCVVDRHIEPIRVPAHHLQLPAIGTREFFLQTSPEFGMKRLLAAGMEAIYQIGPAFRAGEMGAFHNPEFCMVEWYRVGDNLNAGVSLLASLIESLLDDVSVSRKTYQTVFEEWVGCDPLSASVKELARQANQRLGVETAWSDDQDDWLHLLFSECVQPNLGQRQPVIVTHYPASQSALAKLCANDPRTAERFELFFEGVELANGYHELLDPQELVNRNRSVNDQRLGDKNEALPIDGALVEAMQSGLPPCSGCALGLDRLLMVLGRADHINEVLPFPIDRA